MQSRVTVEQVKNALGVDLTACLTTRTVSVGSEKTSVPLSPEKALHARDALAKSMYTRVRDPSGALRLRLLHPTRLLLCVLGVTQCTNHALYAADF